MSWSKLSNLSQDFPIGKYFWILYCMEHIFKVYFTTIPTLYVVDINFSAVAHIFFQNKKTNYYSRGRIKKKQYWFRKADSPAPETTFIIKVENNIVGGL